jgi:mannose-6-phosphate isomerase-like protein (cupin superfamily)
MAAIVQTPDDVLAMEFMNLRLRLPVTGKQTGGAWCLIDYLAPPQFAGPLPHYHKVMTETFYVVAGAMTFTLGRAGGGVETVEAPAGTSVVVQPGTLHAFSNRTDAAAHMLIHMSPAGMEEYFPALFALIRKELEAGGRYPPKDPSAIVAMAERFDTFSPPAAGAKGRA